ncbi:hypothetical protein A1C_01020 [Rickettsia akari str. Hartford]|uniref:Uncharacterized protein n=2 Tax=Rickettsia akari TaxID=786 RepID=A8GMA9_RICAH|nr:hypothetical protein A1C_01020 [Rickettsia akari str. Hartford]
MEDVYSLTPHPMRYACLHYLQLLSLPISLAFYVTKLCFTANPVWTWIGFDILYKKMDQAIAKKILHGLPDETAAGQNIPKIVEYVLKKYEENPTLIPLVEHTFMQKFLAKIDKCIPAFSKIVNFWNAGGISYSDEIQTKRELINVIYKQIVSKAYEVGKKGGKLEITDVKALFPEIDFEDKISTKSANLEIEKLEITDVKALFPEIDFEDKINTKSANLEIEKVEVNNEEHLVSEMYINQKHEEATVTTNANNGINPLLNLFMLKALRDEMCQEALQTCVERCIAEIQISKNQACRYEDSLARLQLCSDYNYDDNNTCILEQSVSYLGQTYEHLAPPMIACY